MGTFTPPPSLIGASAHRTRGVPGSPPRADVRQPGGKKAWLLFAMGAGALLFNHALAVSDSKVSLWLLLFGPLLALFGLAAVFDVRILLGAGRHAHLVPTRFRAFAVLVAVLSLLLTAWLFFGVYRAA